MMRHVLAGTVAGAAGTTALNTATYLDMAVRGRAASGAPEKAVERAGDMLRVPVRGEGERYENRLAGIGPLVGLTTGVGVGALYGLARATSWRPTTFVAVVATAGAAMAAADAPLALLGVSDPRTWRPADWAADIVPHLVYGAVTAAAYALFAGRPRGRRR